MSEHPEWCDKRDDPVAVALWRSNRPRLLDVWCGNHEHRLAKFFDIPNVGVRLCVRGLTAKAQDFELGSKEHGADETHTHTALYRLDQLVEPGEWGRCQCGTSVINAQRVRESMATAAPGGRTRELLAEFTSHPRRSSVVD